tara:strand:- start:934 stop:1830 length:897 start_codon:yes stop_codon:yes gene_type:complete
MSVSSLSLTPRDLFLTLMTTILWAIHAPIMKMGVETVDPISLNTMRFGLTALLFLPFARKISIKDWVKLIPVSLFFVCGNLIFAYLALTHLTSNSFVVITQIAQPFTLILAYFLFKEKFGLPTTFGIILALSGLIIVFGAPDILASPIGAVLATIAALSWSIGSLAMKRTGHIKPASFLAYAYLIGTPIALGASYVIEDGQVERILNADKFILGFVLGYQVLIMGAMTLVWSGLMSRNPAQLVTPFLMLQPIFAVIASYFILGETLNPNIFWGGLIVLSGIGIINFRKIQKFYSKSNT